MINQAGLHVPVAWKVGDATVADMNAVRVQIDFEGGDGRLHAAYVGDRASAAADAAP